MKHTKFIAIPQWRNEGSTELYCLFVAADSIDGVISFIRRIVLWSENKFSPNPALAGYQFINLVRSGSSQIWNSQIRYHTMLGNRGLKDIHRQRTDVSLATQAHRVCTAYLRRYWQRQVWSLQAVRVAARPVHSRSSQSLQDRPSSPTHQTRQLVVSWHDACHQESGLLSPLCNPRIISTTSIHHITSPLQVTSFTTAFLLAVTSSSSITYELRVLNCTALVIFRGDRRDHMTPLLRDKLHWLRAKERITFKLCLLVYKAINGLASSYLQDLCLPVTTVCTRSALRSATRGDLVVPRTRWRLGNRAFCVAGPTAWNSLPPDIRTASSLITFKNLLKTHLFIRSYYTT